MINGRYSKQELPSESTCRLVEHIIENYGLDVFLNKDFEDNEKVAKLVTALQNYYKYGKRREKGEEGGDTPERNAATIGQAEGVVEKNGHGRERHNRIVRFKGESRGNTSEISGVRTGSLKDLEDTQKPFRVEGKSHVYGRDKRFGVGKEMAGKVYFHKNYAADILPEGLLSKAEKLLPEGFTYNCLCWDPKKPNELRFDEASHRFHR